MNYWRHKYFLRLKYGEKVPRKAKLAILGRKLSKCELRRMITEFNPEENARFCPVCGCYITWQTGNMASYPERWVKEYCLRCQSLVCVSDNSPYVHVLEIMHEEKCSYKEAINCL